MAETDFAQWRRGLGLSVKQAAELLGLTQVMIYNLEHGASQRGRCVPQRDTRMLMTTIA